MSGTKNMGRLLPKKKYDSTVVRIAGNILSGVLDMPNLHTIGQTGKSSQIHIESVAAGAVATARAIVAEVERTGPKEESC